MSFAEIFRSQIERYPAMKIQDVYKLIHQAALGSEHAVVYPVSAREWMLRELSEMGPGPIEPVMDPISGDGQIMRVHLRPLLAQGGDIETLLEAFVRTANEYRGDVHILENYWEIASRMGYFPASKMEAFIEVKRAEGFPALHHSPVFVENYRPAYRVIRTGFLSPR